MTQPPDCFAALAMTGLPEFRDRRMPEFPRGQAAKCAAMIDQRRAIVRVHVANGADEKRMIAAVATVLDARGDPGGAAPQQRRLFDALETRIDLQRFLAGEIDCEVALMFAQNVDAETARRDYHRMRMSALGDGNHTERGRKGP